MSLCIGIDLGTTYSCVYVYDINTNKIYVCKNSLNENTTPSYIKINGNKIIIGKNAKEVISNQTYYNMKRFIGKKYNECINDLKFCSFNYKDINGDLKIEFNYKNNDEKQINKNNINQINKKNDKNQLIKTDTNNIIYSNNKNLV